MAGLVDSLRTPLGVVACGLVIRFLLAPAAWLPAFRAMMRVPHGGDLPAGTGLTWTDVMRTADGWRAPRAGDGDAGPRWSRRMTFPPG